MELRNVENGCVSVWLMRANDWGESHSKNTNIRTKHMGVELCIAMVAQCNMNGQDKVMISRMRGNSYEQHAISYRILAQAERLSCLQVLT